MCNGFFTSYLVVFLSPKQFWHNTEIVNFFVNYEDNHFCSLSGLQNFNLGPSLVDEVMKAFGGPGKAERLEKLSITNRNTEENSSSATTPCQPEEPETSHDLTVVSPFSVMGKSADNDTFVFTEVAVCDGLPDVETSVTENDKRCSSQDGAESRQSSQMSDVLPKSFSKVPTTLADIKCNGEVVERDDAAIEIWQQQQQQQEEMPRKKLEQLCTSVYRKSTGDATSLAAGSKYPAVIGNCSLSPRPAYPRDSAVRGLSATKNSSSSTLSSSSEERIPAGVSSRVASSLVAASSSSLPARSSVVRDSWSKLHRPPGSKVPSAESSDSESSNLLQRLKGKASLSRLSGLRLSIDSRTSKSGPPTQNLSVNVHFFNRLREQELQNAAHSEGDNLKLTESVESNNQKPSSSPGMSNHLPSLRLDATRSKSRISEHQETDSSGVETVSGGTEGASPIFSPHEEVARLSCQSTESHDSFSHDSEHSSIATQPSDEGVYSDDSVAASADELRPRTEQRMPTSRSAAAPTSAIMLGISDKLDIFWTCPVNFRQLINVDESRVKDEEQQDVAERYNAHTDLCYEDLMECELHGSVDVYRYFVLIFAVFHFIGSYFLFVKCPVCNCFCFFL